MTERTPTRAGSRTGAAVTAATVEEFERERLSAESRLDAARERLRLIDNQVRDLCAQGLPRGNERIALRRLCSMRRQARRAYWRAGIVVACWRLSPAARAYLARCTCGACGRRNSAQPLIPMPLTEQEGLCDRCLHREDERQRRSALRRWACDLLLRSRQAPRSVVVLDTETTGLDPRADEVIELALLDGDTEHSSFHTLLCPTVPVTSAAQAYHGLTADLLADAPRFDAIAPRLLPLLNDKLVVVFNRFHVGNCSGGGCEGW